MQLRRVHLLACSILIMSLVNKPKVSLVLRRNGILNNTEYYTNGNSVIATSLLLAEPTSWNDPLVKFAERLICFFLNHALNTDYQITIYF